MSTESTPTEHQLLFFYTIDPEAEPPQKALQNSAIDCAKEVEFDIGSELIRLNLHNNPRNQTLFHAFSHRAKKCVGTPYFFNKTNGDYICGYSHCSEVRKWAGLPPNKTESEVKKN